MGKIPEDYMEKVYAGWISKIIGIRLGAAVEGWTYQRIKDLFGELTQYPAEYKNFAADDDSNGPLFFLRALEDKKGEALTAQDIGEALLNYAPYEHGFFWWGGYGISTEHTAYLNLRNGIKAPHSGSIEQNGAAVAEQIGGQIFIDTWGLVAPGDPELAASLAEKAASVTHGGNGVYGGVFVASAISYAFVESDIRAIIEKALSFIPSECEYTRAVRAVMKYYDEYPDNWRDCYQYVYGNFGYDRYPGACHIIPNISVMILALLYGKGNYDDTLNICNMCGWDTDCNVGNVATIMGVRFGLSAINYEKWIKPINDLLICSSVMGSMNIIDIPYCASYIAKLAYRLAGEKPPVIWRERIDDKPDLCHFEYPFSTHAMRVRTDGPSGNTAHIFNSDEAAFSGKRSLKMFVTRLQPEQEVFLYKRTYYFKDDFSDSRYDPAFSPLLYPGQTVTGKLYIPEYGHATTVCMYVRDNRANCVIYGERIFAEKCKWYELQVDIPAMDGGLIDEAGFCLKAPDETYRKNSKTRQICVFIDDLSFEGKPEYTLDFEKEVTEVWSERHTDITQITRLKGNAELRDKQLYITCKDFGEWYTGRHDWRDYTVSFTLTPVSGETHLVNFRVQGAIRSYAAGFDGAGKFRLLKNTNGYIVLAETNYIWSCGETYTITVTASGNHLIVSCKEVKIEYSDDDAPYLTGAIGVSVHGESCSQYKTIKVGRNV